MLLESDPKEQVEEQYRRKNNKVYNWKAMRLIARNGPQFFSKIKNNDLESILPLIFDSEKKGQLGAQEEPGMETKLTEEDKQITSRPDDPEEEAPLPSAAPVQDEEMAIGDPTDLAVDEAAVKKEEGAVEL